MIEEGEQIQREQDAAKGIPSRHDTHYCFSHISLPARVLDPGGLEFVEELMGKRGCRLLANVWNQVGGQKINRSDKTNQLDFERVWSDLTDRWKAIVITPPPALEPLEAHLIGIWRDYSPSDPLPEAAGPSTANAPRDVRYFCLERGHTEGMTMVGEWLGVADRKNLGPGPEPVPEAMIHFMAKLHGIDPNFRNRSWAPPDTTQQSGASPPRPHKPTGITQAGQTPREFCGLPKRLERYRQQLQEQDNATANDEPVAPARSGGPAKVRRSQPVSVANELKKLAALRSDDVISEQEFQTLKQQLIEGA